MQNIDSDQKWISTGSNQGFLLKLHKMPALSEEFAAQMSTLSQLGVMCFKDVETEFLARFPEAVKQDPMLADLDGLSGEELSAAIDTKLYRIFHMPPNAMSEQARAFLRNAYYYLVTVHEETSPKVQGFATFMGGGPFPEGEFKITVLGVDKGCRRLGLGGQLVQALTSFGIPHKKLLVTTRPSNSVAIHTYHRLGFVEDTAAEENAPPQFIKGHWIHLKYTEPSVL
ncbi:MAG: GNAT family N-acetyltransferase [Chlamydiia bacterium]|nr:GNAT family N-acetyltransferase [Chlamydiia bacterium]